MSMPDLGGSGSFLFYRMAIVLSLLALAGIPPLAGFFVKSFFFFFVASGGLALSMLFLAFNMCSLYFYLSSTRLLILSSGRGRLPTFVWRSSVSLEVASAIVFLLLLLLASPLFLDTALIVSLSLLS